MSKIITISILASSLLFAVTPNEINKEAILFLKENQPIKAYNLLKTEYKNNNFDNQTLFLLGTSAKQNGDTDNAIKYFEELLTKDTGAMRVRLDLAMLYYKVKNLDKAKDLLFIVKSSNPPKKVGDNIDNFLATIQKGVQKNYSLYASIGYLYDSNVNAGPDTDTVLIYNLPFTLSSDAKETSDTAIKYSFGVNHMFQINKVAIQSNASFNAIDYKKIDTLDHQSLSLSTGPAWRQNQKTTFSFPLILNVTKIGHIDKYYSVNKGISPQINYKYLPNLSLTTRLSLSNKNYYKKPLRESNSWILSPSLRYFLNQSSWINMSGYRGKVSSKTITSSNNSNGMNLGYFKSFSQKINIFISSSINKTNYHGTENAYNKSRKDTFKSVSANLSYYIEGINSNLSFNTNYTTNSSNIEMYDYNRKQISINISKSF